LHQKPGKGARIMWRNEGKIRMKAAIVLFCCLALFLLGPAAVSLSANVQWTQLPLYVLPGQAPDIYSLAIDPSNSQTLYAGTWGNWLYKSSDGGTSWLESANGLDGSVVPSLALDPSNPKILYAGTDYGVYKSTNGGTSWAAFSSGLNGGVQCVAIDPSNSQTLYAGVFKSTTGGVSWTEFSNGLPSIDMRSLAIDPSNSQTLYAGIYTYGVFKSTNGGTNWTDASSGLTNGVIICLVIDPANSQTLYAGTDGGGVCKSSNGGSSWVATSSGLTNNSVWSLAIDPSNSQILYAGTDGGGVCKSSNGGATWVEYSGGLTSSSAWSLAIDPSNSQILYAGTHLGVFKWTSGSTPSPSPSPSPTPSPSPSPSPSPTTPPGSFTDVPPGYWAHDEIMSLVTTGVINGYPDGTFKPENPVTRAEFAKMALLSLGYTQVYPASPSFPDLDPTAWYYGYVEGAVKNGLVQGYPDGTFQPQGHITMAEILTVIMRAKSRTPQDPVVPAPVILLRDLDGSLRPITADDWFFQIVGSAENWGLLRFPEKVQIAQPGSGPDEYEFRFNSPASRAQTAVFLWR
jgi:photosystem II stability/assembly factor-like uncharacterized protein